MRWWGLESAAQRAGTGARLACLRFLTCHMGTVTAPWFLGLTCKAPRTGWHRGCPQSCCAVAPAPGVRRAPPQAVLCAAGGEGRLAAGTARTPSWRRGLCGAAGVRVSPGRPLRGTFSPWGLAQQAPCLHPTPVGRVRRAGCGGQTDPCLRAPKADLEL